jgi:tRNA nucleotidyltransferase (CCA-adding enzyme)
MNMEIKLPSYVEDLIKRLNEHNKECYVVGGAIRSMLLGLPVHDYDLTTNALPDEMEEIFSDYHTIETGIQHGTLTVISDHHPIEITTYRKDGEYKDHRRPDQVIFTTAIQEDCARRDFTVNAFCYDGKGEIRDFFNGMEDLHNHVIRCIGDPYRRFEEDALRILRAIRFAAQLNFTIEENTSRALRSKKEELHFVSMERIHEETAGFLRARSCADLLDVYRDVFSVFLPEIRNIPEAQWQETLEAMKRSVNDDDIRLALLLSNDAFEDPHRILNRLKYSNADSRKIQALLKYEDADVSSKPALKKLLSKLPCLFADYVNYLSAKKPYFKKEEVLSLYHEIQNNQECYTLKQLALNGRDLIAIGYKGKRISEELNHLLDQVMEEVLPNEKDILIHTAREELS